MSSPPSRLNPYLVALAAGCAGFALNGFELPVFGGTALIFGGSLSLLIASTLGPVYGGITAAIAFLHTWLEWQQPAGFLCYTFEAICVGWLLQRRPRLGVLLATALYWFLLGLPILGGFLAWSKDLPFPSNWAIGVIYPLNGLLMAAIAHLIGTSTRVRRLLGLPPLDDSRTPLQRALFRRFGTIAVLPTLFLILLLGQSFDRTLRANAETALADDARDVGDQMKTYLFEHLRDLITLAQQLQVSGIQPTDFSARMEIVRRQYPGFLTLLVAKPNGEIVASAPTVNDRGEPFDLKGMNVADRDYFREALRTKKPFVSGVFRGRGFGNDLIVAVSTPVFGPDGEPSYLLEGSINLKTLIEDLRGHNRVRQRDLVIADQTEKVVATFGEIDIPPLSEFRTHPLFSALSAIQHANIFDISHDGRSRPERHLMANTHAPVLGWHIVLLEPLWVTQRQVAVFYGLAGVWSLIAIALALFLARGTAGEITGPLQKLVRQTHALANRGAPVVEDKPVYPSSELTEISDELQKTAHTLIDSNSRLAAAIAERNQSHQQLRLILLNMDERVRERTLQLDEAYKAAESASVAKSEFLASMSHELRTPLNVILGMSEVLREQTLGPLDAKQLEAVVSVEESGRHLLSLINDILDLSKIEAGMLELDIQECSARDVSESSLRFVRDSAQRKNITLEAFYPPQLSGLHADSRRLKQILVNLLFNAVKFTPENGRIRLDVVEDAEREITTFKVTDTGIGIAREQLPKLFRSFQQIDSALNRKYAGTGLGLALVKSMTEMHGGSVAVESEPGVGSCFIVNLPHGQPGKVKRANLRKVTEDPFAPAPFPDSPLILVAEDHPTNRLLLEHHLRARRCRLVFASNGEEAIERTLSERPDLILMDVQMPVLDGLEATRCLKADARTAGIPIIMLTALAMAEDRLRGLEAGASAYLSKPLQFRELDRLILEQLNRRKRGSPPPFHGQPD